MDTLKDSWGYCAKLNATSDRCQNTRPELQALQWAKRHLENYHKLELFANLL